MTLHWPWTEQTPPFRVVPAAEVEAALRAFLVARWLGAAHNVAMRIDLPLNDSEYLLMTRTQLDAYLRSCPHVEYVIERNDCDDACYRFLARLTEKWGCNGAGKVKDTGTAHYYIIIPLDNQAGGIDVELAEPQVAQVVEPDEGLYQCRVGMLEI